MISKTSAIPFCTATDSLSKLGRPGLQHRRLSAPLFQGQIPQPEKLSLRARMLNWMLAKSGVCIFYGTFNPIHWGHIKNALAVQKMGYRHIIFIPNQNPPHKLNNPELLPCPERLKMIKLGIRGLPGLHAMALDKATKPKGQTNIPGWLPYLLPKGLKIPCIIGDDALQGMDNTYANPFLLERLLFLQNVRNPGDKPVTELHFEGKTYPLKTMVIKGDNDGISSTTVRERIRQGQPVEDLLPLSLAAYIKQQGFYQNTLPLAKASSS